jgi:uncharacterized membrane protein
VLLLGAWGLLHVGFFDDDQLIDTPTYERYGNAIVDAREVPYRDFDLEYPPGALPAFVLPALAGADDYRTVFEWLMFACGAAAIVALALALGAVGAEAFRMTAACAFAGVAPLLLGSVVLTRFDLWPAALTAGSVAALAAARPKLGLGLLAVAASVKIYPLVLVAPAVVYVSRWRGGRQALIAVGVFLGVLAAILGPFAAIAPDGLWASLERQTGRPLQVETLGASVLMVLNRLDLYSPSLVSSFGSQNLVGSAPDALAALHTALQIAAVLGVWALFAAGRAGTERLFAASAASVAAFVAFGKVLSPQFLIWLIPLVPLVWGAAGLAAWGVFAVAMVVTQTWFPFSYWDYVHLGGEAWLVLARNLLLCLLVAVLAVLLRVRGSPSGRAAGSGL